MLPSAVGATASNSEYLCNTYTPQTIRCDENGRSVMLPGLTQSPVLRSQHEAESMRGLNGLTLLQEKERGLIKSILHRQYRYGKLPLRGRRLHLSRDALISL